MYLTVDSLIDINNMITGLNDVTLRIVNARPDGYDKRYMDNNFREVCGKAVSINRSVQ